MGINFFKIGIIYSIGQLFIKGISFGLIPIYSKKLGAEVYGQLILVDTIYNLLSVFLIFSIYSGYIRFRNDDTEGLAFPTAVNFSFISIFIQGIFIICFGKYFSYYLIKIEKSYLILIMIFFRGILEQLIVLFQADYSLDYKVKKITIINIIKTVITLVAIIYFVVLKNEAIFGVYKGYLLGNIIIFIFLIYDNKLKMKLKIDYKILKKMFQFSLGLILGSISYLILSVGDRYFLAGYRNFSDVGVYSIGYKFAGLVQILYIVPFKKIITPFKFSEYRKKNFKIRYSRFFDYYNLLGGLIFLIISNNIKIILYYSTSQEFLKAYMITPLILLSFLLYGQIEFYSLGIQIKNKNYLTSLILLVGGSINVILNFYFVNNYGMFGAAFSTIISYIIMMLLYIKISLPIFHIDFHFKRMFKIVTLMVIFYFVYLIVSLKNYNIIAETVFGNILILIYIYINIKVIINNREKKEIFELLNKVKNRMKL
ncbi:MAG: oligosaccharide flippase family protein [Fusobacterium sp.]